MNPKAFLKWGGIILVVVGILGFIGILGPMAEDSIFGQTWWFDNGENWAHLILGIVGLVAVYAFPASIQRPLVMLLGIVGVLVGLYSAVISTNFLGANLENPADTILHIVVGLWALLASRKKMMGAMSASSGMGGGM